MTTRIAKTTNLGPLTASADCDPCVTALVAVDRMPDVEGVPET